MNELIDELAKEPNENDIPDVSTNEINGDDTPVPTEPPTDWTFLVAIDADQTWTPPEPGAWYRVWVIGKSGAGGKGDSGNSGNDGGKGGAGGNSGGLAGSILQISEPVQCTVNASITDFGGMLNATAGGSANGTYVSGTVGTGSGGTEYNLSGYKGGTGGAPGTHEPYYEEDRYLYYNVTNGRSGNRGENNGQLGGAGGASNASSNSSTYNSGGGGGGGGAKLPSPYAGFPYIPDTITSNADSNYPTLNLNEPKLYGGGGGGKGGSAAGGYHNEGFSNGSSGHAGSPGLIIIEKGAGTNK